MKRFAGDIHYFTHVCQKSQPFDVHFLRYRLRQAEFFVILDRFLPFYPPMDLKNQNFEKMKKPPGDIITLHRCNKSSQVKSTLFPT